MDNGDPLFDGDSGLDVDVDGADLDDDVPVDVVDLPCDGLDANWDDDDDDDDVVLGDAMRRLVGDIDDVILVPSPFLLAMPRIDDDVNDDVLTVKARGWDEYGADAKR
jgi:hypothetical protein